MVQSLENALCCFWATDTFEQAILKDAIGLIDDTNTTAYVAGGIAGLRDGVDAIPACWRQNLRWQDLVAPMLERLLQTHGPV